MPHPTAPINEKRGEPMKGLSRLLLAGILFAPLSAFATPIRVDFTVTALGWNQAPAPGSDYAGFAPGTVGGGHVTFDDSLGSTTNIQAGLPTLDLEFNWLGHTYTEADAALWLTGFDAAGALDFWAIGPTGPSVPGCGLNCMSSVGPTDFWVVGALSRSSNATMHIEGFNGGMYGTVAFTATRDVPEPGTLGMFGAGLLGMILLRRKRSAA
jgi:hypothetical protein